MEPEPNLVKYHIVIILQNIKVLNKMKFVVSENKLVFRSLSSRVGFCQMAIMLHCSMQTQYSWHK